MRWTRRSDTALGGQRRDRGTSLVEVLIAVVLLGGAVTGTLTAVRSATFASALQRDHATAHAWLQSAADALYARDKVLCDPGAADQGRAAVTAAYAATVRLVPNPEGWAESQIGIIDVGFWNAVPLANGVTRFAFGDVCHETIGLGLQMIEIEVRSPSGRILEQVEIVKS